MSTPNTLPGGSRKARHTWTCGALAAAALRACCSALAFNRAAVCELGGYLIGGAFGSVGRMTAVMIHRARPVFVATIEALLLNYWAATRVCCRSRTRDN